MTIFGPACGCRPGSSIQIICAMHRRAPEMLALLQMVAAEIAPDSGNEGGVLLTTESRIKRLLREVTA